MSANAQDATNGADPNYVIDPNATVDDDGGEEQKPDPVALQAQLDDLTRKVEHAESLKTEAEKQAAFWYEQTTKKLETVEKPEPKQEPGFDISDEEFGEALGDKKKLIGLIDRVATQRAQTIAKTVTDEKANAITADQRRLQTAWLKEQERLPDLADNKSALTLLVAAKIRDMQANEEYTGVDPVLAMRMAVREAEAEYLRNGMGDDKVPDETKDAMPRQLNRNAAIAAQAGSKGRKAAPPDKFNGIPADQMAMIEKHAKGLGVTVDKIIANMPNVVKFRG